VALAFRQQIFAWLVGIAVVPAIIAISVMLYARDYAAPVGGAQAWEDAAASWRQLRPGISAEHLTPGTRLALTHHEQELSISLRRAKQAEKLHSVFTGILAGLALSVAVLLFGGAVRLAGHLSRQLSRPIDELISWTGNIERGEPLPVSPPARGAREFSALRDALRRMAGTLEQARAREVEAAELRAFREMSRQVAHELKNPLTPMRFAIQRLAKDANGTNRELIDVLDTESRRLEQMAKDFGDLGRLPEGPTAPVDLGELCDELARSAPEGVIVRVEKHGHVQVMGHYEPLRRALQNLVINAIHAVKDAKRPGEVVLEVSASPEPGTAAAQVKVRDTGVGIPDENLAKVFEPHFTTKVGGTGLGLAIVRQTIVHHQGRIALASTAGRGTTITVTLPRGTP
jgi:signal transduction histidine kinase